MRNPPQPYKHANQTHLDYGKSADSTLLNKSRQNFARGGATYPVAGAKGSARWQGAGPEHYAAMRAEMSPSDFATFKRVATPEQYNNFMGNGPASNSLNTPVNSSNPSVQHTADLARQFGINPGSSSAPAPGMTTNSVSTSGPLSGSRSAGVNNYVFPA